MKNTLFMLLAALMLLASCKKDDSDPEQTKDYVQLKTGNYWIYRVSQIDSLGMETLTNEYDSVYISGDTTINGNVYAVKKYSTAIFPTEYLRDSSNYLVDLWGIKRFSPVNFSDTLKKGFRIIYPNDTIFFYYCKMMDGKAMVTVPAGIFMALNYRETYLPTANLPYTTPVRNNYLYAKNIGVVQFNVNFVYSRRQMVWRLVRYNVN